MGLLIIDWNPTKKMLRAFGVCTGLFCALLGAWVFFRYSLFGFGLGPHTARTVGIVLWAVGAVSFLLAIVLARALWGLYVVLNGLAFPIGLVVSHVVLFVIFYFLFAPIGLLFRLIRRDALHRKFDPKAGSYWVPYEPHPPAKRYFRQF